MSTGTCWTGKPKMKPVNSSAALGWGAKLVIALGETTRGAPSAGNTTPTGFPFCFTWKKL